MRLLWIALLTVLCLLIFPVCVFAPSDALLTADNPPSAELYIQLEKLSEALYLDTSLIPHGFDRDTLVRLYNFLGEHVVPNCRTPFPEYCDRLPVIVRYVPFDEGGNFPETTEGFAGWCDVVFVDCLLPLEGCCSLNLTRQNPAEVMAFLALVAIPDVTSPDYLPQLWGFTAHEIAHTCGAIDGPRYPFYADDRLLAPVEAVSDTYYWFGIARPLEAGFRGVVWDAWNDTCADSLCAALHDDVFGPGSG